MTYELSEYMDVQSFQNFKNALTNMKKSLNQLSLVYAQEFAASIRKNKPINDDFKSKLAVMLDECDNQKIKEFYQDVALFLTQSDSIICEERISKLVDTYSLFPGHNILMREAFNQHKFTLEELTEAAGEIQNASWTKKDPEFQKAILRRIRETSWHNAHSKKPEALKALLEEQENYKALQIKRNVIIEYNNQI